MTAKNLLLAAALLAGGLGLGYALWGQAGAGGKAPAVSAAAAPAGERKVLYWYDPMYPGTHFDKPGKSPFMDMDLVPRYADEGAGAGVRIDPVQVQNLAVRTEKVRRGRLTFTRQVPANISYNRYSMAKVQPRAEGFVEKIRAYAVGDAIAQGAPLAEITVPQWAADQSEYLLLKAQGGDPAVVRGVREKMRLTGMPEEMLAAVDRTGRVQTRMTIKAPVAGIITTLDVYPGMNVGKDTTIAVIEGTDPVWVTANVPESDVHLLAGKSRVRLSVAAYPDRGFQAESFTLLPDADPATHTVPLRLSVRNPEGLLRPGMTAGISLRGKGEEALLIPTQSLIDFGEEQRVIVRAADGTFVPRKVAVLRSSREQTAVASGLEEGEEVVTTGLFLIDSEANLRGALEKMRADAAPAADKAPEAQPAPKDKAAAASGHAPEDKAAPAAGGSQGAGGAASGRQGS
ncbi:efflux RND transporter periplasmic adaptor subunit [Desulfovibrio legallii]|uniref:Membrane fusion protein, Cu(I)/Ag(I) efflux system n=1 Tax=Desulfovibrio legallii TaxID=571438 RepID=A0A1G7PA60_9BACT|nr:efflux RND transporter periplasmic adaptor subunit [Desulfovibrio legallii]SDF83205.1 membrane fusion protein, Cu(I)/Ag(I) efflux system [Desulfovibrio legallii]